MSVDFTKLVSQGRAKAPGKPWEPHELEALLTLERERKLSRVVAADYIRNGILTVEDYDASREVKFSPKTSDQAEAEAEVALKETGPAAIGKAKRASKKI